MSAICGVSRLNHADAADDLSRLQRVLQPFGDDAVSDWVSGSVGLASRLYDILPEDRFDRQPIETASGRYVVVADVRLTERDDLIAQLGLGSAATLSDSAIVAAAVDHWHETAFDRIYGAFAIAAWDRMDQRWLLARDHAGQKPLFYYRDAAIFAFASMPVALQALPEVPRGSDERQMARFLRLLPPEPSFSYFEAISRVDPGHYVIVSDAGVERQRYWKPDLTPLILPTPAAYEAALTERLDAAVASALRGHGGAVGVQMSAGFDSTTVAVIAASQIKQADGSVIAFTSVPREGFDGEVMRHQFADEGALAATVADAHDNMTLVRVRSTDTPVSNLDRASSVHGLPLLNLCNQVWTDAIDGEAKRRGLRIMLHGSMGNATISESGVIALPELFAARRFGTWLRIALGLVRSGWMRWSGVLWNTAAPFLPTPVWALGERLTQRDPVEISRCSALRPEIWAATTEVAKAINDTAHPLDQAWIAETEKPDKNSVVARLAMLNEDFGSSDKGALATWGLDYRDPTADRRLIEFSLRIPVEELIRDGQPRSLLRRVMKNRLPTAVLENRRKGYQAADWYESLSRGKALVSEEIERIEMFEPSAQMVDLERLKQLVADWPAAGSKAWSDPNTIADYRHALLRGISAAAFMRKAAGSNY